MAKRSKARAVADVAVAAEVDSSVDYRVKPMTRVSETFHTPLSDASCLFIIGYVDDGGQLEARRWCLSSLQQ